MKIEKISNYKIPMIKRIENGYLDVENQDISTSSIRAFELEKDGLIGDRVSWCVQADSQNKKFRIVPNSTHGRFVIFYTQLSNVHKITIGSNEYVDWTTAALRFPMPCVVTYEDSNDKEKEMNKITINGKTIEYPGSGDIVIKDGEIMVNGVTVEECAANPNIVIEGNVTSLACDGSVEVRGNTGSIDCGGSCNVTGNVEGDINAGGSINCKNVSGNIDAGGSVHCKNTASDILDICRKKGPMSKEDLWRGFKE